MMRTLYNYFSSAKPVIYIAVLSVVVIVLSTKGITDEGIIAVNGDMPRYMMNGVYFYDLLSDMPVANPIEHAYRYFAQYPALSIGHHPLLLGFAEVPFYAIFGISVFSARMTIVFFMLLAAITWFLMIRSIYDEEIALLSSLLLFTTPYIVHFSREVMSEIPTIALIIMSAYFFYLYSETDKKKYAFAFAFSMILSIYARQTAIFMFPVFFFYLLINRKSRKLIQKEVIISYIIMAALIMPLVFITLKYSQRNVDIVAQQALTEKLSLSNLSFFLKGLWTDYLTLPVLIISLISIVVSVYRKEKRAIIFLLWIVICYLFFTSLGHPRLRYAIYWIPAFCLFAALSVNFFRYRTLRVFVSTVIIVIVGYQFAVAYQAEPWYARGYEEAAKYVVENRKGESVLLSSEEDTGFFIFFVRKHDPDRKMLVLRAGKMFTLYKGRIYLGDRITSREEIYEILNDFGVAYVVIEDVEREARVLEWLREEVKSENFILRKKIPLQLRHLEELTIPLDIYEYKGYTPPEEGKVLHIEIPLMGGSIKIPFKELIQKD